MKEQGFKVLNSIQNAFAISLNIPEYVPMNTSETARMDGEILSQDDEPKEEQPLSKFHANMLCPDCKKTSVFSFAMMFQKVTCPECRASFRVPVGADEFIYDKHVLELPYLNIFRAYNRENDFYGDLIAYEKAENQDCELEEVVSVVRAFSQMKLANYIKPKYFQVDELAYYITRPQAAYQMKLYVENKEETSKNQLASILEQTTVLLTSLSKRNVFGALLPSDICLNSESHVELCDYGLREALFDKLGTQLPYRYLAPELVKGAERTEASTVYSLGIVAATLFNGEEPFQESDPQQVHVERENYLENFKETKLPSFIKILLNVNPEKRPPLMQARDFFLRLSRQRS